MSSSNEGDPPRKQSPKIIPQGPDDFIGIAAWLWCRLSLDPQFYASALKPGVVCDYTELLARDSGWSLHELYPLFWHCYKASQSNVRQYITCDLPHVDFIYAGRTAKWLERHHVSFDEEGRKLFEWLQHLHPDLSKELEAVINSEPLLGSVDRKKMQVLTYKGWIDVQSGDLLDAIERLTNPKGEWLINWECFGSDPAVNTRLNKLLAKVAPALRDHVNSGTLGYRWNDTPSSARSKPRKPKNPT